MKESGKNRTLEIPDELLELARKNISINPKYYEEYNVKRS